MSYPNYRKEIAGSLYTNKPITKAMKEFINTFAKTRHCKRNPVKLAFAIKHTPNVQPFIATINGGMINESYIIASDAKTFACDQHIELDKLLINNDYIIDYNTPTPTLPSLYCNFIVPDSNEKSKSSIIWENNSNEASEELVKKWLEWLIHNIFEPDGYKLNGALSYAGEDSWDNGIIAVTNNKVNIVSDNKFLLHDIMTLIDPNTRIIINKNDNFTFNVIKKEIKRSTDYKTVEYATIKSITWNKDGVVINVE